MKTFLIVTAALTLHLHPLFLSRGEAAKVKVVEKKVMRGRTEVARVGVVNRGVRADLFVGRGIGRAGFVGVGFGFNRGIGFGLGFNRGFFGFGNNGFGRSFAPFGAFGGGYGGTFGQSFGIGSGLSTYASPAMLTYGGGLAAGYAVPLPVASAMTYGAVGTGNYGITGQTTEESVDPLTGAKVTRTVTTFGLLR